MTSPPAPARPAPLAGISRTDWLLAAGLVAALLLIYGPALRGEFLWNDRDYVTAPHLRSVEGLGRIWTKVGATEQYYPLLHSTFWVQHRLWGDQPLGYHLALVLQHALGALLLVAILRRLRVPGAWLAGWIFAVHPVAVESVAWISEQKNTLSLVFYLAAALAYLRYSERRRAGDYALATALFAGALLSKTTTAMLPVALWAVLLWRRGWREWTRDLPALAPWVVLGAAAGLFSAWVEKRYIGAEGGVFLLEPLQRLALAGQNIWFYLGKFIWPADLMFIYPRREPDGTLLALLPAVLVGVTLALLIRHRHRGTGPVLVTALYFGALLFPVMGFLNVYFFRFSFVSDHFPYLANLGLAALAGAALTAAVGRIPSSVARRLPLVALVAVLGALSWRQSGIYRDNEALWRASLARNPGAVMAWLNLGDLLARRQDHAGAIAAFQRALELEPENPHAHNDIGCALIVLGRADEALAWLRRAAELDPAGKDGPSNLGLALSTLGRHDEAVASFREALRREPGEATVHGSLAVELMLAGRGEEARIHLREAERLKPDDARVRANAGDVLRQLGLWTEAEARYRTALALQPDLGEAEAGLGLTFLASGRTAEALGHLERAVQRLPADPLLRMNLGLALAESGRLGEAVSQLRESDRLAPGQPAVVRSLAEVLAHAGNWAEAVPAYARAVALLPEDADLRANHGVALASLERWDEAVAELRAAIRLRPGFAGARHNLALVLDAAGRPEEAARARAEAARWEDPGGR